MTFFSFPIEHLDLSINNITNIGGIEIGKALKKNHNL
jgi:hypothetical protein